jgi:hypothetical protein
VRRYFECGRFNGKLIRRFELHCNRSRFCQWRKAKIRDFRNDHRRLAINRSESALGEVLIELLKNEIEDDHYNKPRTKD